MFYSMLLTFLFISTKPRFQRFLLRPGRGAEHCDRFVCLRVCLSVREHNSVTARSIVTKSFVQIPCGRGSVLLWRRCDTLCTSGFMDDVTFGRNGPYGDALPLPYGVAALRYLGGVWCLWMLASIKCSYIICYWPGTHIVHVLETRWSLTWCISSVISIFVTTSDNNIAFCAILY